MTTINPLKSTLSSSILFALASWGDQLIGSRIKFMCDNEAVASTINKTSIRGEAINPLQLILLSATV
jgi:hypothetical protein